MAVILVSVLKSKRKRKLWVDRQASGRKYRLIYMVDSMPHLPLSNSEYILMLSSLDIEKTENYILYSSQAEKNSGNLIYSRSNLLNKTIYILK